MYFQGILKVNYNNLKIRDFHLMSQDVKYCWSFSSVLSNSPEGRIEAVHVGFYWCYCRTLIYEQIKRTISLH